MSLKPDTRPSQQRDGQSPNSFSCGAVGGSNGSKQLALPENTTRIASYIQITSTSHSSIQEVYFPKCGSERQEFDMNTLVTKIFRFLQQLVDAWWE